MPWFIFRNCLKVIQPWHRLLNWAGIPSNICSILNWNKNFLVIYNIFYYYRGMLRCYIIQYLEHLILIQRMSTWNIRRDNYLLVLSDNNIPILFLFSWNIYGILTNFQNFINPSFSKLHAINKYRYLYYFKILMLPRELFNLTFF